MPTSEENEITRIIDLRSDTVTLPSKEMRETVLTAELGDDVFGEDPTVNALQEKVAEMLGKEAALFVPSGTMGNLICVLTHCWGRGCEVILGDKSHIYIYEQGGIAQLGGVHPRTVRNNPDGTFLIEDLLSHVRGDSSNPHFPVTSLVCIENTHNLSGGKVLPLHWIDQVGKTCRDLKIPLHIDGARLFNASIALDEPLSRLTRDAASVSICLSKGLGAPVGSVIAGSAEFIKRAHRIRKVLGGGMRQCGVLASMGLYAIANATKTIQNDHHNLATVVESLASFKNLIFTIESIENLTNILFLEMNDEKVSSTQFCTRMFETTTEERKELKGEIKCKLAPLSKNAVRLSMNCNVSAEDTELLIRKLKFVIKEFETALSG